MFKIGLSYSKEEIENYCESHNYYFGEYIDWLIIRNEYKAIRFYKKGYNDYECNNIIIDF